MESSKSLRYELIKNYVAQSTEKDADGLIFLWQRMAVEIVALVGEGGFNSLYERCIGLTQISFPWLEIDPTLAHSVHRYAELQLRFEEQSTAQSINDKGHIASGAEPDQPDVRKDIVPAVDDNLTAQVREKWANARENAAHRQDKQNAIMFLDLDRFKYINDSLGHTIGDQLLQSIALRQVVCVRNSNTVSRQGGDEFVLLLPSIDHASNAALCAQKILEAFKLPHSIDQHSLHISVSIGVSIYPIDGLDAETLIRNADTAMYHAKENGREVYKFFKQEMNDRAVQRQSVEAGLRLALERQEFVLHYQSKVNMKSGAIVGCGALIRWQHPERGLLLPELSEAVPD